MLTKTLVPTTALLLAAGCVLEPAAYEAGSLHWAVAVAGQEARGSFGDSYLFAVEGFGLDSAGLLDERLGDDAAYFCDHYSPRAGRRVRVIVRYSGTELVEGTGPAAPLLDRTASSRRFVERGDGVWSAEGGEGFERRRLFVWVDEGGAYGARNLARLNYELADRRLVFWVLFNAADAAVLGFGRD